MFDLAGADAESESPEGAVGGRMAVAADDGHPRLREPQFGSDDVDDAASGMGGAVEGNTEFGAVFLELPDLSRRQRVTPGQGGVERRNGMVHRRNSLSGTAYTETALAQSLKGLR